MGLLDTITAQDAHGQAKTRLAPTPPARESTRALLQPDGKYVLGEVLGEGGMGVVRSAVQPSLQRVVAVKSLRPNAPDADALAVLREAWATGFLEHPSIVPVHEIATAEDGSPLVVMRRIEGITWHDCLRDPAWAAAAGARDLLEQNLRILLQVCQALVFAHEKGVVHRDVKPANVMLGAFGEVYLLDWGIACALFGDALEHLPSARESIEPAGTIPYLAPEMAGLLDCGVSPRTDVYLLGAVLFEIATGAPPHPNDFALAKKAIAATPPKMPSDMPPELVAICQRAMQHDPAQRYESVAALRDDVRRFLTHRDSVHVAAEGRALLAELRSAIATDAPRRVLYDLWGECRFAFREALRTWPENAQAREGLRLAAVALAERELSREPRVASAILDEVAEPPSTLRSRVQAAIEADEKERQRTADVATDFDPSIAWRLRSIVLLLAGVAWTISALVGDRIGPWTYSRFAIGSALPIPILAFLRWGMKTLSTTRFNRRVLGALLVVCSAHAMLMVVAGPLGIELASARTLQLAVATVVAVTTAITVDARLWPMTVGLTLATGVAVMHPAWRPLATALGYLGVTINFAFVWRAHHRA